MGGALRVIARFCGTLQVPLDHGQQAFPAKGLLDRFLVWGPCGLSLDHARLMWKQPQMACKHGRTVRGSTQRLQFVNTVSVLLLSQDPAPEAGSVHVPTGLCHSTADFAVLHSVEP